MCVSVCVCLSFSLLYVCVFVVILMRSALFILNHVAFYVRFLFFCSVLLPLLWVVFLKQKFHLEKRLVYSSTKLSSLCSVGLNPPSKSNFFYWLLPWLFIVFTAFNIILRIILMGLIFIVIARESKLRSVLLWISNNKKATNCVPSFVIWRYQMKKNLFSPIKRRAPNY